MFLVPVLMLGAWQLGWRAGTPEPILAESPEFIQIYWKAWENYHASLISPPPGTGFPQSLLAPSGELKFWEGVTSVLFSRWGWRATPTDALLAFWCSRVTSTGEAPERVLFPEGTSVGKAGRGPILGLCAWETYELTGSLSSLERTFAPAVREYAYWASVHEKGEPPRILVPGEKPPRVKPSPPPAISASAQAMLLMDAEFLRRCARALRLSSAERFFQNEVKERSRRFLSLWDEESKAFRLKDASGAPVEGISLEGFFGCIGGHLAGSLPVGWDEGLSLGELFARRLPFPRVPATDARYAGDAGVFPMDQYMIIRALLDSGKRDYAGYAGEKILRMYSRAGGEGGALYNEYGPDTALPAPGAQAQSPEAGFVAIGILMEGILGIRVHAEKNEVSWNVWRTDEHGVRNLHFGENRVSLVTKKRETRRTPPVIEGECERGFTLVVTVGSQKWERRISSGKFRWELR